MNRNIERTHLKTVLDEGLGVEKTMKEHLPCCHCHLHTEKENYVLCCIS